jgi:deoxyribonuclease-1
MKAPGAVAVGLIGLLIIVSYLENRSEFVSAKLNRVLTVSTGTNNTVKHRIEDSQMARPLFWAELYPQGGVSLYCAQSFSRFDHRGLNIEHVFPMSWVTNSLNCGTRKQCRRNSSVFNTIEADLHNLYPSRTDLNKDRASFRFAEITGEERRYGKNCDFEVDQRARSVEPTDSVRGNIARSMFYMVDRYSEYGLKLFKKQRKLLASWHQLDPPDEDERMRNKMIERVQGNINIFISDPEQLDIKLEQGRFN